MCKACKMDPAMVRKMYIGQGMVEPDDFYKETDYTPRKKKSNKVCKKSKTGDPCDFSVERVRGSWFNERTESWHWSTELICSRCTKRNWKSVKFWKSRTLPRVDKDSKVL